MAPKQPSRFKENGVRKKLLITFYEVTNQSNRAVLHISYYASDNMQWLIHQLLKKPLGTIFFRVPTPLNCS